MRAYLNELREQQSSDEALSNKNGFTYLLVAQVQELVELNAAVGEGAERPLLLEVGSDLGIGDSGISLANGSQVPSALHPPSSRDLATGTLTILRLGRRSCGGGT